MKFKKIVCVDRTKMDDWALEELQNYSEEEIEVHDDYPDSKQEILNRIEDADAAGFMAHDFG